MDLEPGSTLGRYRLLEPIGRGSMAEAYKAKSFGVEGFEKPDPRIFRLAMERAGVEPGRSVYVGDNPEFDVEPAMAVGMFPVLIDRRDRYPDAPGARIASLEELPDVLGLTGR